MNLLRRLQFRFRALFAKRKLDAEMDAEMRSHLEMQTKENVDSGLAPDQARYEALRQFGWVESIKEICREQRGLPWLEDLAQDVRYGMRGLLKNIGFSATAVLTLALGIGATTTLFCWLNALLFRPLPFPQPKSLLLLSEVWTEKGWGRSGVSLPTSMIGGNKVAPSNRWVRLSRYHFACSSKPWFKPCRPPKYPPGYWMF